MSKHRLCSKNFTNVKELYSGKYIRQYSCINHEEWSFNEIYQLVNIKKSTWFGKNVIKKMRKDNLLSQFSNVLCTQCYTVYKKRAVNHPFTIKLTHIWNNLFSVISFIVFSNYWFHYWVFGYILCFHSNFL